MDLFTLTRPKSGRAVSGLAVRSVCLPYTAISRPIALDQSATGSSREPASARQPGRETRGTGIPPATSMPWHDNGTACLAGCAACLAKFRCANNRLPRRGSHCFYLASAKLP